MTLFKKAALLLTGGAIVLAPVAATAAQSVAKARATSVSGGANQLDGNSGWIVGALGLAAGITAMIIIFGDDDEDEPVSP
ncbi:hypothetical protein KNJ79_09870 [Sphingopyxis indica]|uniref:hypothetical protein n=1 Tax=Sphingopyxis indica TaxID=436663 RepID=UPI002938E687|nr:hypothetical protein [Sphingopyxis indica]WOF45150.1 hypothetical protein KNJ79_09870 [Sphingopyxis indica]